jgi:hypothetical protein
MSPSLLLLLLLPGLLLGSSRATVLLLGPTTDLQSPDEAGGVDSAEIVRQLLLLVEGDGVASWNQTFTHVNGSGGALHARQQVFGFMSALQQSNYARAANALNLRLSIETGGAFCGAGSGATAAQNALRKLAPFLEAGGHFSYVALESCFSRTHAGCKAQSQQATAEEVAAFAKTLAEGLQQPLIPKFFLYDALPHMTVDKSSSSPGGGKWPRNVPSYDLDLGTLLRLLRTAMATQKLALEGYVLLLGFLRTIADTEVWRLYVVWRHEKHRRCRLYVCCTYSHADTPNAPISFLSPHSPGTGSTARTNTRETTPTPRNRYRRAAASRKWRTRLCSLRAWGWR